MKGLNNAGVETFKGNFDRYLAREIIQNSLDARDDANKPVTVRFSKQQIKRSDIPDLDSLRESLKRCLEFWRSDKKACAFLERAIEVASKPKLTALRASDFNTRGLQGGDKDPSGVWFHLVRCAGSSPKNAGEGGAFGIGKNAPFAASYLRTVLYSTRNKANETIFAGVATLLSYLMPDGATAQDVWYLGQERGASVRDPELLPELFRRDEPGLDIIILGFPDEDAWDNDLIYSVLDNFWPAVQFGDLEVQIGDKTINKSNLAEWLKRHSEESDDFAAHLYFNSFSQPHHHFSEELPHLGKCDLYISAGEAELPKKIAMVRKAGMVVWPQNFRSIIPFCGVFLCRNDVGNRKLSEMEPPKHDVWDPDHPEKGANKRIYKELVDFIRSKLRDLAPVDPEQVITIPGLDKYLPDDEDSDENSFAPEDGSEKGESAQAAPPAAITPIRLLPLDRETRQKHGKSDEDGGDDGVATDVLEEVEGPEFPDGPPGPDNPPGPPRPPGPGPGTTLVPSHRDTRSKVAAQPVVKIKYRVFSTNPLAGVYRVNVTSKATRNVEANLVFSCAGDDRKEPAILSVARSANAADLGLRAGNIVGPLALEPDQPVQFEVVLSVPGRVAMEVQAHEA
jgi:hypothetical protein